LVSFRIFAAGKFAYCGVREGSSGVVWRAKGRYTGRKLVADRTNVGWRDNLADCIRDVNNDATENLIVLTTHDTFYRKDFIDIVQIGKSGLFWAADEVHFMGVAKTVEDLLD
jgi:hypothetical protein